MPTPSLTPLNAVVALLGDLAVAVTQSGKPADDALTDALTQLKAPMKAISDAAGKSAADARRLLQDNIAFDKGTELREFFQNVAVSMIEAQKQLDISSINYSHEAAAARLPPARFSIPSVHAELRFGFSNLTGKGINVFLFSRQEQREEHSESSVSFDLVAAPPQPREALLPGARPLPVVTGPRRDTVLDAVIQKIDARLQPQLLANRAVAAVFEYPGVAPLQFLILWPGKPASPAARPETWSFFAVAVLQGDTLVRDVFEKKGILQGSGVLVIPTTAELQAMPPEALQDLALDLGDALMNVCLTLGGPVPPPV